MSARMPTTAGAKTYEIIFPDGSIVLNVNPERLTRASPTRIEVVQTLTGAVVDHFGAALGNGTIAGTTGWGPPLASRSTGGGIDGKAQFELLKQRFEQWQDRAAITADPAQVTCEIINAIDDEHLRVVFLQLAWTRSIGRPFLYEFTLDYRILYDFSAPFRNAATPQLNGTGTVGPGDTPPFPDRPGQPN